MGAALVSAGLLIGGLGSLAQAGPPGSTRRVAVHSYVVRTGDTLWSIAQRVSERDADPRGLVQRIAEANGVDAGYLVPGQTLRIPV